MRFSRMSEEEIIGMKCGKLTILRYSEKRGRNGASYVWCQCECGNIKEVGLSNLRCGGIKSCGCIVRNQLRKHGKSKTRLYQIYCGMKERSNNPNCKSYKNYGGRGITICPEWLGEHGFENFSEWSYKNGYDENAKRGECTIERKDVNGNYCPENCCWATMDEQAKNKTNTVKYEINGESLTLSEISKKYDVDLGTLTGRVYTLGYDIQKAISKRHMTCHPNVKKYTFGGKTLTLTEWSKELGVPRETLVYRIKSGRTYDKVFTKQKDIHILKKNGTGD